MGDAAAAEALKEMLVRSGWPYEELLDLGGATPEWWDKLECGAAFLRLRKIAGLTQAEVAVRAGFTQSFVSRFENGADVRMSDLRRLYAALKLAPTVIPRWAGEGRRVDPRLENSARA